MLGKITILAGFLLGIQVLAVAQIPGDEVLKRRYPFLNLGLNTIDGRSSLDGFYQKLDSVKSGGRKLVSVVHIGDSHIQPDFTGQVLRQHLQKTYGNAGRGLVFPYQLARSNSPDDIRSSSQQSWAYNRLAHPEIKVPSGVSGYGVVSNNSGKSTIRLQLRTANNESQFSEMRLFTSDGNWWASVNDTSEQVLFNVDSNRNYLQTLTLDGSISGVTVGLDSSAQAALYGMDLRNGNSGVLFHSIGVNGARADHYNAAGDFWNQLPALEADLYIVSLGTNEAQTRVFNETAYRKHLLLLLENLRNSSPGASIIFTTPPPSFRGKYLNPNVARIRNTILAFCRENQIACWDLHAILQPRSGFTRIMHRDRIHYTAEGYRLIGMLLAKALL